MNQPHFDEFLTIADDYHRQHPEQRAGQAFFNALDAVRPDIADDIRATRLDPFHHDHVTAEVYQFVQGQW